MPPLAFFNLKWIGFFALGGLSVVIYLTLLKDDKEKKEFLNYFYPNFFLYNLIYNVTGILIVVVGSIIIVLLMKAIGINTLPVFGY